MSVELIAGVLVGVIGMVITVAIAAWQSYSEPNKKSLPAKSEIGYFALKALVTAHRSSTDSDTAMAYDELFTEIIEDCNENTTGGNFELSDKNKTLHSYTADSIKRLSSPRSRLLGPLVEEHESGYQITKLGIDVFDKLPYEVSERSRQLDEYLKGSHDPRTRRRAGTASVAQVPTRSTREYRQPDTPAQWRHFLYMEMPEHETRTIEELKQTIAQELKIGNRRRVRTNEQIDHAIAWHIQQGYLDQESDGSIRLAAPKVGKTVNDFIH